MNRYILFDSGCSVCNQLANDIEHLSEHRLVARSLHDNEMKAILDDVIPSRNWEPVLLEIDGDNFRVYTGQHLKWRILSILGIRRSLKIINLINASEAARVGSGRREFLRRGGLVLAGLLLPIGGDAQKRVVSEVRCPPPILGFTPLLADTQEVISLRAKTILPTPDSGLGVPQWEHVHQVMYSTGKYASAYMVPLESSDDEGGSYLMTAGDNGMNRDVSLVAQIVLHSETNISVKWLSLSGQEIGTVIFKEGQVIDARHGEANAAPDGLEWGCFQGCLAASGITFWPICVPACATCSGYPHPYNPGCWGCAACLGGRAFFCILECWR